ncbi:Nicotinate-nucleotide pyrophosphorylase [carboxylating] [Gordonia insulae]|uniref:nicotinate-nucleotide diphosphorylase (carboxylating) n=1 Tax=Gordonia insulae TaxID=2420509 RepID=A0A3G8JFQ9_9ACTN|nr:Nicotinate-nucleotide pyrophosphorylase [carboxylating] [Gordonia insulae]
MSEAFVGQVAATEVGDLAVTEEIRSLIRTALTEDLRYGPDVTTAATVPADAVTDAAIVSRADGVIAGVPVVLAVFDEVIGAGAYTVTSSVVDGSRVAPGDVVLSVHAPTAGLLTAERTALNLISHLSGIATATDRWVQAVEGTGAKVRDSRKTLPGLRLLQKYAVRAGGESTIAWVSAMRP